MPELPEVVTVARKLKDIINGKEIKDINVIYENIVTKESLPLSNLINKKVLNVTNKGKFILFHFDNYILVSHLRMEGKYHIKKTREKITKHEHVIFKFSDFEMRYDDVRKFGRMTLINKKDLFTFKPLYSLGKEANKITSNELYDIIKKKDKPIKSILLDQHITSGLGNIYVNEVLYESRINPYTKGKDLTENQVLKITESSKKILNKAIEEGGTSIRTYSSLGDEGNYQHYLNVHLKSRCPHCNGEIKKEKIGGRGTYYCPNCQK